MAETSPGTFQERSLARRLQAGDETALVELYDNYSPFVFGLALRVLGDRGAAEDITQEIFVQIWQQPDRFDPARGTLRAFLGTMTHRRAVDHIRREEARRRRETKVSTQPVPSPEIDDGILRSATSAAVRAAGRDAARRTTPGTRARLLPGAHLSTGRNGARHSGRHGQIASAPCTRTHHPSAAPGGERAMGMNGNDRDPDMLAAYALDAVDEDDALMIDAELATSAEAASDVALLQSAAGEYAAATSPDIRPPAELRDRVLTNAFATREGMAPTPADARDVHRLEAERFSLLLRQLTQAQWDASVDPPEFAGWTVRDLVSHVAASEALTAQLLGSPLAQVPETDTGNESRTALVQARHRGMSVDEIVDEFEAATRCRDRGSRRPRRRRGRKHRSRLVGCTDAAVDAVRLPCVRDLDPRRRHPSCCWSCAASAARTEPADHEQPSFAMDRPHACHGRPRHVPDHRRSRPDRARRGHARDPTRARTRARCDDTGVHLAARRRRLLLGTRSARASRRSALRSRRRYPARRAAHRVHCPRSRSCRPAAAASGR